LWCVSLFFPRFCWPRLPACFRRPRTMEVSAERSSVVSLAGHKLIWRMMIDRYAALLDFLWFHKDLITYIYIYIHISVCVWFWYDFIWFIRICVDLIWVWLKRRVWIVPRWSGRMERVSYIGDLW
jgi:hypothetical protein